MDYVRVVVICMISKMLMFSWFDANDDVKLREIMYKNAARPRDDCKKKKTK